MQTLSLCHICRQGYRQKLAPVPSPQKGRAIPPWVKTTGLASPRRVNALGGYFMVKEAVPLTEQAFSGKETKPALPTVGNIAVKCAKCKEILYTRDWEKNLKVCSRCNHHFRLTAPERIALLVDPDSFVEMDADLTSADPLHFTTQPPSYSDQRTYAEKLIAEQRKTGLTDAVVSGHATIETLPLALAVMDFRFMGGSMGSVVGEKITRAV